MNNEQLLAIAQAHLGAALISSSEEKNMLILELPADRMYDTLAHFKTHPEANMHFLTTLCCTHYPADKGAELCMMYQLHNLVKNIRIRLKCRIPIAKPQMPTITTLWEAANWQERETFDFFGVIFNGHPNLTRILNMDDMTYHPMRKEYPLEDATRDDKNDAMFGR
jgi:NADH-quinone oxidoreductase subunit C